MKMLTKEQMDAMKPRIDEIMEQVTKNDDIHEVLAQMYVHGLPDKTRWQGEAMADAVLEQIDTFDKDFTATANGEDVLQRMVDELAQDKTPAERCRIFALLTAGILGAAKASQSGEDAETVKAELSDFDKTASFTEEEATSEREAELKANLVEAVKNNPLILQGLMKTDKSLEELAAEDENASLLVQIGEDERNMRAITAMLIYLDMKNGLLKDVPPTMNIQQITSVACASFQQAKITSACEKGEISTDWAAILLSILGILLLVHVVFYAILIEGAVAFAAMNFWLAIPTLIVMTFATVKVATEIMETWLNEVVGEVISTGRLAIKTVIAGTKKCISFFNEKVLSPTTKWIANKWNSLVAFFHSKAEKLKQKKTEEVVEEEEYEAEENAELALE